MADYRRAFAFSSSCSRSLASLDAAPRGRSLPLKPPIPPLAHRSNEAGDGAVTPAAAATPPRRNKDSPAELFV
jgi:hypothetical protein